MAYLSGEEVEELAELKSRVRRFHQAAAGLSTLFFEHGAGGEGEGAACIDHAHLHAIPVSAANFLHAVEHLIRKLGHPLDESPRAGTAYLALEFESGARAIWSDQGAPCQYFRQLFAVAVGNPDRWKWQSCLALDEIERTQNWLTECVEKWARK